MGTSRRQTSKSPHHMQGGKGTFKVTAGCPKSPALGNGHGSPAQGWASIYIDMYDMNVVAFIFQSCYFFKGQII